MKNVLFLLALFVSVGLFSQTEGVVQGTIIDLEANNEPLLFADVTLKDTAWHAQTNFRGNFEITDVTPGVYTLEVSYLGYETLVISVEVNERGVTKIDRGMGAKTISLGDVADSDLKVQSTAIASIEKED